jgi:hypothetical protein
MDKEEGRKKEKERRKRKKEEKKEKKKRRGENEKSARAISTFYNLNLTSEAVLPNIFQNDSNSTKEATPPRSRSRFQRSQSPVKHAQSFAQPKSL